MDLFSYNYFNASELIIGIFGESYELCLEQIKRQYVTATALASMFGTSSFYAFANLTFTVDKRLLTRLYREPHDGPLSKSSNRVGSW